MDYDLSTLEALVDPAQSPVVIVNRYVDEFEAPNEIRVCAWIKNTSATTQSILVRQTVDYVPAGLGVKAIPLAPVSLTIAAGAVAEVTALVARPADFRWRFSAYLIEIEEQSSGERLTMERQMAFCFHKEDGDQPGDNHRSSITQWYTLPNLDDQQTHEMLPVVVITGDVISDYEITPTPGIPVELGPGHAIVGTGGRPGVSAAGTSTIPEGTDLLVTVFGIVNGEVATLATLPYVQDTVPPTVTSFSMVGSDATLVASDSSAEVHQATLFLSYGGVVWSSRPMVRTAGDFSTPTTFEASLTDLPSGVPVTLRAGVRDNPGAYAYSASITYTP